MSEKLSDLPEKLTLDSDDFIYIVDNEEVTPADRSKKIKAGLVIQDVSNFETTTQLNARDTDNRDRGNHTGTQNAATISGLADVATSGDYDDLANKPTIPQNAGDIGLGNVDNTSDANKPISIATQIELDAKQPTIAAFSKAILHQASATAGDVFGVPNWAVNAQGGLDRIIPASTDNGGFKTVNNNFLNITNAEDSPNEQYLVNFNRASIDVTDAEFDLGSNDRAVTIINNDVQATTDANIGEITFVTNNFNLEGAKNVRGFSYAYGFGDVKENVHINGAMQGYGFQPNFESNTTVETTNAYVNAFYDSLNAPGTVFGFYTSLQASPNVGGIANDRNMNVVNLNPTVGEFQGNAGFVGVGIFGTLGDFDAGGYTGVAVNTNINEVGNATGINVVQGITDCENYTGLNVDTTNVTASGNKRAAFFGGNVDINGNLTFSGALSLGQLNAFYATSSVDGGGQPQNLHSLITQMTAPNGVTTANVDAIGVNTAMLITLEEDSVSTSGPFGLGFTALALPCVVTTETNSSLDNMSGTTTAINLDGASTGGTIDTIKVNRSVVIPNGVTTVNNARGFQYDAPFGQIGTVNHGFYTAVDCDNYFRGGLVVGEDSEVRANSSVGLEVASTTKAILNSRMTTTERNALTAVNGMQIYNTSTDKLQVYAAGSWVDLH